jgi:hypothetical protein
VHIFHLYPTKYDGQVCVTCDDAYWEHCFFNQYLDDRCSVNGSASMASNAVYIYLVSTIT